MKTNARCICRSVLAVGLLALLGQCQPVPKPFAAAHEGDFSAIQIGPRAGVVVLPVTSGAGEDGREGGGEEVGRKLAVEMARALRRREVTASTKPGHRRSHRLRGDAVLRPDGLLRLTWRLFTAADVESMSISQNRKVSPLAWRRGDAALLARLASDAADAIDRRLRRRERGQGRRLALAPVTLGPLDGVPGQGIGNLARAMQAALAGAGVPLSPEPVDDGFILLGSMYVAPGKEPGGGANTDGSRRIEIIWHLIHSDGRELGRVSQANNVPAAQLSGDWQDLARAIARAGAPGVVNLLRRDHGGQTSRR